MHFSPTSEALLFTRGAAAVSPPRRFKILQYWTANRASRRLAVFGLSEKMLLQLWRCRIKVVGLVIKKFDGGLPDE